MKPMLTSIALALAIPAAAQTAPSNKFFASNPYRECDGVRATVMLGMAEVKALHLNSMLTKELDSVYAKIGNYLSMNLCAAAADYVPAFIALKQQTMLLAPPKPTPTPEPTPQPLAWKAPLEDSGVDAGKLFTTIEEALDRYAGPHATPQDALFGASIMNLTIQCKQEAEPAPCLECTVGFITVYDRRR